MPVARSVKESEIERAAEVGFIAFGGTLDEWRTAAHDHIGWHGLDRMLVVEQDGEIVSSMFIIPEGMHLGSSVVPSAAVGGVATVPEARCLGCAGAMMEETVRRMRAWGVATSAMWPFSFKYYRKFGWEAGGEGRAATWPRDVSFRIDARGSVERVAAEDQKPLAAFWESISARHRCATARSDGHWEYFLRPTEFGGGRPDRGGLVCRDGGKIAGYAFYTVPEQKEGEETPPVSVTELRAENPNAEVALILALSARVDRPRFQASLHRNDPIRHLAVDPRAIECTLDENFGFRVIDPMLIFPTMHTEEPCAPIVLGVEDVLQGSHAYRLSFPGGPLEAAPTDAAPDAQCTIQTFSQITSGLVPVEAAARAGLLRGTADAITALRAATADYTAPYRSYLERG